MTLIGNIDNKGTLQGQINSANGYLTGVISNADLLGGQIVAERGLKGEKGDKGDTGDTGATGVGIASVTYVSSSGLVDTYKITFTNGNETTFTVTNGQDGHNPVITASKSGTKTSIFLDGNKIAEIDDGATGATGNGIVSIAKTGSAGTNPVVDTYTVTYTNGNTDTFTVTNGVKGDTGATPVITATKVGKVTTVKADGVDIATINDGDDGHSPVVTASKVDKTTTIYVDGTAIATIEDGEDGTDTKVTQTASTPSSYTYWRPIIVGYASGSSEGFTPTTQTNTTYAFNTLECQPSTGTIRCGVLDLYKGSYTVKASPDTLTGNRTITLPDKSGTMAMTDDIHNVPSGGSSGQVLAKHSGTDYDLEWVNQSGGGGTVTDVEVNGTSVLSGTVAEVTVPTKTSDLSNDSLFPRGNKATFYGTCATAGATKTVTCADFKSADLTAGVTIVIAFSVANTGAVADLTLNVNSTGAYHIKYNNAGTISNLGDKSYLKASTYMFYFDGTYWILCGYDTNTNTIGYTIRTNGLQMKMKTACYRYRLCFTSADGEYLVPANSSTSTSATASKTVTTEKIDPWGRIVYYNTTTAVSANSYPTASYLTQQYNGVTLGYSFNRTGVALTLSTYKPVYVKATPQTDGSAIIDGTTPFVQALPSTEDGKIYIFIGIATGATTIEFTLEHPVYYYKDSQIRLWTNQTTSSGGGVYYAEYGTDTFSDVKTAYDAGMTLICSKTDTSGGTTVEAFFPLLDFIDISGSCQFLFGTSSNTDYVQYTLEDDDSWSSYTESATATPTASKDALFDSNAHMNSTDMSSADVSTFVSGLNVSGINAVDYITDYGTSGIWTYRKWNSGFCELRVKYTTPRSTGNNNFTATFPWTFADVPHVQVTGGATSNINARAEYANATTTAVDCYVNATTGSYVWAYIYVSGYLA